LTLIVLELAERMAVALVLTGEFLFLGFPLVRKYLSNQGLFSQLFYSHVLSATLMISVLWVAYSVARSITPLIATSGILVFGGIVGTALFAYDFTRRRRPISREGWGFILLICFATVLVISSAVTLPFSVQGDAYGYYVPLGRYLNQYPGAYVDSYYRFSLSRNFGYYAIYAHADLLGGFLDSYLFLPIPFLLGTIFGVISLSKKLTHQNMVPLLGASCYVFSICFGLILKYNMFYLGNLFMATLAVYFSYFLLAGGRSVLEKTILPFSTFAMLLLYDFTALLLIPLAFGYVAHKKPKLAFYIVAGVALPLSLVLSQQNVPFVLVQIQQLDIASFVAFLGLVLVVLAGIRGGSVGTTQPLRISYPTILAYITAIASVASQRIVNLFTYGFMTVDNYTLSSAVIAYMKRGYWGYQTPPDVANTLLSMFFSDVFFGWGLLFTAYGMFLYRGRPVATFFLTALPLTVLVETVNDNYFRFAIFLVPLIVVFMAVGLYTLVHRNAFLLAFTLSFVALFERAIVIFPTVDYEHRAIANSFDVALFAATAVIVAMFYLTRGNHRVRAATSALTTPVRSLVARSRSLTAVVSVLKPARSRQIASVAILGLCVLMISYNVLAPQHFVYVNPTDTDAALVDQQVLPLVQAPSTVLMVELIHPNFNFYKDVVVIQMAQPWILESFLRLHLANVTTLVTWLSVSKIRYVFVDRGLTAGNEDVFGLFDQLSISCYMYNQCVPRFDDGRFVLLEIIM
jgi:hypothetical protein